MTRFFDEVFLPTQVCSICQEEKDITSFYFRKDQNNYRKSCKACCSIISAKYRQNNKESIRQAKSDYYKKNRGKILFKSKIYYNLNKEKIISNARLYYQNHKEKMIEYKRQWYEENKVNISLKRKIFYQKNKSKYRECNLYYNRNRYKNDLTFRIKSRISCAIRKCIFKSNKSCTSHLPYTMEQLKQHLENQFQDWMNWDNWTIYNSKTWDDNNPSTWTWNIDHIIPHSTFHYTSMEDDEFKKCWGLDNLRPYSSKQNLLDGLSRIRHTDQNGVKK